MFITVKVDRMTENKKIMIEHENLLVIEVTIVRLSLSHYILRSNSLHEYALTWCDKIIDV